MKRFQLIMMLLMVGLLQACASTETLYAQYEHHCEDESLSIINNISGVAVYSNVLEQASPWEQAVYFDYDQSGLAEIELARLDKNIQVLKQFPSLKMNIRGYTDSIASEQYNRKLALRRVQTVYNYFLEKGVTQERVIQTPLGEQLFIATNDTYENRALNRRVEMVLLTSDGHLLPSIASDPNDAGFTYPENVSAPGTEKESKR
jgi:outer membrane protein OmpA-like peptidoglycan-associated protein